MYLFIVRIAINFSKDKNGQSTIPLVVAVMRYVESLQNEQLKRAVTKYVRRGGVRRRKKREREEFKRPGSCNSLLSNIMEILQVDVDVREKTKDRWKIIMAKCYIQGQLLNAGGAEEERNNIPRCFISCLVYVLVWVRLIVNPVAFLYPDGRIPTQMRPLPEHWQLTVVSASLFDSSSLL